jgi:sensor histidine kinase YesM
MFPSPLSSLLAAGLAMVVVALTVRSVQAEAARRKAEAAELALTRAELRALRAQINPHFLFNALNTIRYFVRTDPETARRLLLNLSDVFQRALRSGEFVPLQDELSYVESYLALEKARLDERLQINWIIRAEEYLDHLVPTLILQPIVENAVVHGIAAKSGGGMVRISIEEVNGNLVLQVDDDGVGISPVQLAKIRHPAKEGGTALGLRNVDGRLRALYGEAYQLLVESKVGEGTRVQIRIPVASELPKAKGP